MSAVSHPLAFCGACGAVLYRFCVDTTRHWLNVANFWYLTIT